MNLYRSGNLGSAIGCAKVEENESHYLITDIAFTTETGGDIDFQYVHFKLADFPEVDKTGNGGYFRISNGNYYFREIVIHWNEGDETFRLTNATDGAVKVIRIALKKG